MEHKLTPPEEEECIAVTKQLIQIPSSVNDGRRIYDHMWHYLQDHGLNPMFETIENPYVTYHKCSNLYVKIGDGLGPKIMLNGHLDTVGALEGWFHSPYAGTEEAGRIYGLGAADMKGGCAAAIAAVEALMGRKQEIHGELFLSFVFGEEAPFSLGADTLLREHDLNGYDLIIIPEPSPLLAINDYCYTHKKIHDSAFPVAIIGAEGRILYEIEFFGKSAHASHPSQGINALHDAARLISRLAKFDMFSHIKMGRGHYCVLNIEGGDQTFTVPGYCRIFVNRQLTLGEDEGSTTRELQMIINDLNLKSKVTIRKRFSPDAKLEYRPYLCENSAYMDRFIRRLKVQFQSANEVCRFTTSSVGDFNILTTRTGVSTLVFGPGGGNIHAPNEYVNRDEIIATANYLLDFLMEVY